MTHLDIHELTVPAGMSDPGAGEFAEMVALTNGIEKDTWGEDSFTYAADDVLPSFQAQSFEDRITFVARLGPIMVGVAGVRFPLEEDAITATVDIQVAAAVRENGIGGALLDRAEELVAAGGRTTIGGYSHHFASWPDIDGPRIGGAVGAAVIPEQLPTVRFLISHGYRLGQVERTSECLLPVPAERLSRIEHEASGTAGPDYRVVSWRGRTPDEWVEQFATLRSHMAEDVPQAGVVIDDEAWTVQRVREFEQMMLDRGEPLVTTAAAHMPTRELVAYTEIVVPSGARLLEQHDTLVISGHRGHQLGLLVKSANMRQVHTIAPQARRILTWNAEENEHMIAVNDVLGFRLRGYMGSWQKTLP